MATKPKLARPPGALRRTWWRFVGWLGSRAAAAQLALEGRTALANADAAVAQERQERADAEAKLRSAEVVIAERENEIRLLRLEKEQLEGTVAVREKEIEELTKWLERTNKRLDADIAQEVARENRALHPANRPQPN